VMSYFFRDLHLNECQLDELGTFGSVPVTGERTI